MTIRLGAALEEWKRVEISIQRNPLVLRKVREACHKYPEPKVMQAKESGEYFKMAIDACQNGQLEKLKGTSLGIALSLLVDAPVFDEHPQFRTLLVNEAMRRGDRKSTNSLFRCLLETFNSESNLTAELHQRVRAQRNLLGTKYERLAEACDFFEEGYGLESLRQRIIRAADVHDDLTEIGLTSSLMNSRFGRELQSIAVLSAVESGELDPSLLRKLLNWIKESRGALGADDAELYAVLLLPFVSRNPGELVQRIVSDFLIKGFGDPRLRSWPNLPGDRDGENRQRCLAVIRSWLARAFLDLFISIIDRTAVERMWPARKAFWQPYFDRGLVSDVTVILAGDAHRQAQSIKAASADLGYLTWSSLEGGSKDHSVLLLKLDRLTIAEWSHNGKIRFWPDDRGAPKFHKKSYVAGDLRGGSKVRVSAGESMRGIVHWPDGAWQQRARYAIRNLTGIQL